MPYLEIALESVTMPADGGCWGCEMFLERGDAAVYDLRDRKLFCGSCADRLRSCAREYLVTYERDGRARYPADDSVNLEVPWAERQEAKHERASWDPYQRTWWVPRYWDLRPFERWLPQTRRVGACSACASAIMLLESCLHIEPDGYRVSLCAACGYARLVERLRTRAEAGGSWDADDVHYYVEASYEYFVDLAPCSGYESVDEVLSRPEWRHWGGFAGDAVVRQIVRGLSSLRKARENVPRANHLVAESLEVLVEYDTFQDSGTRKEAVAMLREASDLRGGSADRKRWAFHHLYDLTYAADEWLTRGLHWSEAEFVPRFGRSESDFRFVAGKPREVH
jgi:hypothetical protein